MSCHQASLVLDSAAVATVLGSRARSDGTRRLSFHSHVFNVELKVRPGHGKLCCITGQVGLASGGAPVSGARIRFGEEEHDLVETDEYGQFAVKSFSPNKAQNLCIVKGETQLSCCLPAMDAA